MESENENLLGLLVNSMKEQYETSESDLISLLNEVDPETLLITVIAKLLSGPEGKTGESYGTNPVLVELLAFYALSSNSANEKRSITPMDLINCIEFLKKLISAKSFKGMGESGEGLGRSPTDFLKMYSDVVRGNAFPEQTAGKISLIQGRFDNWFKSKIGITPSRAIDTFYACVGHAEDKLNEILNNVRNYADREIAKWNADDKTIEVEVDGNSLTIQTETREDALIYLGMTKFIEQTVELYPVRLNELPLEPVLSVEEEQSLKDLISVSSATFDRISDQGDIRKYPLYVFEDGSCALSSLSNAFDYLWEAFESVAKSDQSFYDSRYQKFKSKWVECQTVELLKRIIPHDFIYQTLDYPDLSRGGDSTTELDIAVVWEPFILLIEVKAKQFRFESQTGDAGRLRSDIRANVEDAHKQALRALEYINSEESVDFVERSTGRVLTVNKREVYKVFPISLTLHSLQTLPIQLDKMKELGLFQDGNFPFSICLSDLDLITRTCQTPDVLLHFVEKRLLLLNESDEEYLGDELDLFSAYLDTRLHRNNYISPDQQVTGIMMSGYSEVFDRLIMYDRGELAEKPNIRLKVSDEIEYILRCLRRRNDSDSRFIAFALLELEDNLLESISQAIGDIRTRDIPDSIHRRVTFSNDHLAVSIVASNLAATATLADKTRQRVVIEKYRRRHDKGIGIGLISQNGRIKLDTVVYMEFQWENDDAVEQLIEDEVAFRPDPSTTMPRVNDPCFCGSGKKYKKCCRRKVEENKWKLPQT